MTHPFYMSISDIGELNFKQINTILEEHKNQNEKRMVLLNKSIKHFKSTLPVFDIMRLEI